MEASRNIAYLLSLPTNRCINAGSPWQCFSVNIHVIQQFCAATQRVTFNNSGRIKWLTCKCGDVLYLVGHKWLLCSHIQAE